MSKCIYLEYDAKTGAYNCGGNDVWYDECDVCMVTTDGDSA